MTGSVVLVLAAGGVWDDVAGWVGSGLAAGVLVLVAVLAVAGVWIAAWSLWRTRGTAVTGAEVESSASKFVER